MSEFVSDEQVETFEARLVAYWNRRSHYVDEAGYEIPFWHKAGREAGIDDEFITVIEGDYMQDGKPAVLVAETWLFLREGRGVRRREWLESDDPLFEAAEKSWALRHPNDRK